MNRSLSKKKTIAVTVLLIMAVVACTLLYSKGSDFVVERTIRGSNILLGAIFVGGSLAFGTVKLHELSSIGNTKHYEFPRTIAVSALLISVSLVAFAGFKMNEAYGKSRNDRIRATVLKKSMDFITGHTLLEVQTATVTRTLPIAKEKFSDFATGDTLDLKVVEGLFGSNVLLPSDPIKID